MAGWQGWAEFVSTLRPPVQTLWASYAADSEHTTVDMLFMFMSTKRRTVNFGAACRAKLDTAWEAMVRFLAKGFEHYVLDMYSQHHDLGALPRLAKRSSKTCGGGVDAEVAWRILERSLEVYGASESTCVAVKSDEPAFQGMSPTSGSRRACGMMP